MSNIDFDITKELQLINEFSKFMNSNIGFPDNVTGVFHRHDHLASIVSKADEFADTWRCYFLHPGFNKPLALLNSLNMREALFIYRSDFWHAAEFEHDDDDSKTAATAALIYNGEVAGTTDICFEFLSYILTRFAAKNILKYEDIFYAIDNNEKRFIDEYIQECKNSASKPRKINMLFLGDEK